MFDEFPEVLKPCDVMKALGIGKMPFILCFHQTNLKVKR